MSILSTSSLDFAREHISKYYDSDFFPKAFEFEAVWHGWEEVVRELTSKNVGKLLVSSPRALTAPKTRAGFRVVHQLQPLDTLVYTALAAEVARDVEVARVPAERHVACSYRLELKDGSFFAGGAGWEEFTATSESLAQTHEFVLLTDITDFYNQISLHRVNNAIELSNAKWKPLAAELEDFIGRLNSKFSKGIPVGPAASIVMAEAVLNDVDEFIANQGFIHTRYVDDFRIFASSRRELRRFLDAMTSYLYLNHRLTLSPEKTRVLDSKTFVQKGLHNPYAQLKIEILETLEIFNPYTEEVEEIAFPIEDPQAALKEKLQEALNALIEFPYLDLGLARAIVRKARRARVRELGPDLLEQFDFFVPIINDLMLYLAEITDDSTAEIFRPLLLKILHSQMLDNRLVRYWVEWYLAQHKYYLQEPSIRAFIFAGPNTETQSMAAITSGNIAWIRERKADVLSMGDWARRAVLNAARTLPSDERLAWLRMCRANSPVLLDRLVASWVIDTA